MNASILIVEDDKITSAILSKYLKEAGYTNIYIASWILSRNENKA